MLDTKTALKIRKLDIILVRISSITNHFNREMNNLYKTEQLDLAERLKQESPEMTVVCHVKKLEAIDDDSITLPDWMLDDLKCKVGDPLTLSIDLQLLDLDTGPFILNKVTLEPISQNYLELGLTQ